VAKLPLPPSPLPVPAIIATLKTGTRLCRVYFAGGAHPSSWGGFRFYGPTKSRFDHHDPPSKVDPTRKGILYAARHPTTCLAEAFQASRIINRTSGNPRLVMFEVVRDVVLLDLTGLWPTQAGASMAISSGPRPRARMWSREIYSSYPGVEGLLYGSSMHRSQPCVALYERARTALPVVPSLDRALDDAALLSRLNQAATDLNYGVV
jgi:hypothetical protein